MFIFGINMSEFITVLENFEKSSIVSNSFKNKNKHMQKHNCVPKLRIIIFSTYNSLPNGYVRKDTNFRKSHGFHKIRKVNFISLPNRK